MGNAEGTVYFIIWVDTPENTGFRVEEIKFFVDVERLQMTGISSPVPFIVVAIYLVTGVTILQVGIEINATTYFPVGFRIDIAICFATDVTVVFMVGA